MRHRTRKARLHNRRYTPGYFFSSSDSVPPGLDFYKHINAKWIRNVRVPPWIASYGVSEEVEIQIAKKLRAILSDCIHKYKSGKTMSTIEKTVGILGESCLNYHNQKNSVRTLRNFITKLQCLRDENDVAATIGEMARYKIKGFLWVYGQYENTLKKKYCFSLGVGALGLPDMSYYSDEKTMLAYKRLLRKLGEICNVDMLADAADLEREIATSLSLALDDKLAQWKGKELEEAFKFPMGIFFEAMKIPDWRTQVFSLDSKKWLKTLGSLLKSLTISQWKLLLTNQLIMHFLPYLPPPFDDLHYEFFKKTLKGQSEKLPQYALLLDVSQDYLTQHMSRLFVEEIMKSSVKKEASLFANEILSSALLRLHQTEWMEPETRRAACEKVRKMRLDIAYPCFSSPLQAPELSDDNLLENILKLGDHETRMETKKLGKIRKDLEWEEPVFDVNAYYYPPSNQLVVPSGSLYWPFFCSTAPPGWNYGGLGCIIGHEITHAFDKEGKELDPEGYEKKWWTSKDNSEFDKRADALTKLFSAQKVQGHSVSGELTLSENIADLGGLAISLHALTRSLDASKASEKERREAIRNFFHSYAVSWRVKEKSQKVIQGLFMDRHAPAHLRVNMIVSQFQEWYDAFDIKETDALFVLPKNRIKIF